MPTPILPSLGRGLGLTPYAALQAQLFHSPAYSETDLNGGVFAGAFADKSGTDTRGAELAITPNWSLSGKFDGEFARGSQTYAGTGKVRYRW